MHVANRASLSAYQLSRLLHPWVLALPEPGLTWDGIFSNMYHLSQQCNFVGAVQINWVSAYSVESAGHSNPALPVHNYIISLYWSVMTMSTIGYGDVTPKTQYERMYEIFGMILGASVYAYMVGAICSIVASMNAASAEFNQQMDRSVACLE